MKEKLVSVIVPIYNCEQYLDSCISSIVNQTYKKLQIILVDDGSSDSSGLICDKWKLKDERIHVYHKSNGGVSSARNNALINADGFYVTFIDSDDYIDSNYFKDMMKIALENDFPDIIKSQSVKESKKYKKFSNNSYFGLFDFHKDFDKLAEMFIVKHEFGSVWSSLFKNESFKEIKFDEEYSYGEDYLFYFMCLVKSKKIYITDKVYYHYVINENSLTHKFDSNKMLKKIMDHYRIDLIIDNYFIEKKEFK